MSWSPFLSPTTSFFARTGPRRSCNHAQPAVLGVVIDARYIEDFLLDPATAEVTTGWERWYNHKRGMLQPDFCFLLQLTTNVLL